MSKLTPKSAYQDGVFVSQGKDGMMVVNVYQEGDTFDYPSVIYTRGQDDALWSHYVRTKSARSKSVRWASSEEIMPDDPLHAVLNLLTSQAWLLHGVHATPEEFINGRHYERDNGAVAAGVRGSVESGDPGVPGREAVATLPTR